MGTDSFVIIASNLVSVAALGGIMWNKIDRLQTRVEEQNGRVDDLEAWKQRRDGYDQGFKSAKERYGGPDIE